jgi:hypothetical protein
MTDPGTLVQHLHDAIERHAGEPFYRQLRIRLREMGTNVLNEQGQFRSLQRACRECPELAAELRDLGLGDIAALNTLFPDPRTAELIQAFNTLVERHWEAR